VVKILRESYPDFGPTLAAEKLQQRHGITVAKETIRRILIELLDHGSSESNPTRPSEW
jgi:hypothetical protein